MQEATQNELQILSGGAAQGLVGQMKDRFQSRTGLGLGGSFGAVGAMRDKLLGGAACDVLILTQALIDELTTQGWVQPGSARPLGAVYTGVAVRAGEAAPDVATAASLKAALQAAPGIYFPDPVKATAGIHFRKVLGALGLDASQASWRTFPNGATAMGEMAASGASGSVGCTQVTEILNTPGVQLVGLLPKEFELATVYTAAVCSRARDADAAAALVALLAGEEAAAARQACGFRVA